MSIQRLSAMLLLFSLSSAAPAAAGSKVPRLIRELVEDYGGVRSNLRLHDGGFPEFEHLGTQIKLGNPDRGVENGGDGHDTEGPLHNNLRDSVIQQVMSTFHRKLLIRTDSRQICGSGCSKEKENAERSGTTGAGEAHKLNPKSWGHWALVT